MRKILSGVLVMVGLLSFIALSTPTYAAVTGDTCLNNPTAAGCPCAISPNSIACQDLDPHGGGTDDLITNIMNMLMWGIGVLGVIMIIASGFVYITSQGSPEKAKKAKSMLIYSVVGLILAMLAFTIINFVIQTVNGA